MRRLLLLMLISCLIPTFVSAQVLLYDTWADGSCTETDLPNESAFWAGKPANITMGTGSLAYSIGSSSEKMWTYFAPNGSPASLNVGEKLIATITFSPEVALYDQTSRNFRFGLFTDPTDSQILKNTNDDGGGKGDQGQDDPWTDSMGYAVQFSIGETAAAAIQLGKRTDLTNNSLLGSSDAYTWGSNGGKAIGVTLGTVYTMTLTLDYQAVDLMQVDFTFTGGDVNVGGSLTDNGLGDQPVYTNFDQLFIRPSKNEGVADVLDFRSIKVELIPEPATMVLLGLGGLLTIRRKR